MGGAPSKTVSDTCTGGCEHIHSHLPRQNRSSSCNSVRDSGALLSGHASPQLSTRRLHVTHMVPTQYPVAHAVTTSAHRAPAALQKPPWMCATPYAAGRPGATAWAHADAAYSALARAGRPRQEPRKVGPQRRPQKRQPSLGSHGGKSRRRQPTAGCAAGWNRPTRLELLDDLESRAIREVSGRRC
jgi:hypothetical protein